MADIPTGAVADLIGALSQASVNMYHPGHRPCLADCLGDLASDLREESDVVLERIVAVVADFARAARIDEIRAIADWLDAEAHRDFLDADSRPYAADRLRERADEMETQR